MAVPTERAKHNSKRSSYLKRHYNSRERWARRNVRDARRRCELFGIPFNLTYEDVLAEWPADNRCLILGVELVLMTKGPNNASIDRIIPSIGYVRGNIAVISRRANQLKNDATVGEVRAILAWLESRSG